MAEWTLSIARRKIKANWIFFIPVFVISDSVNFEILGSFIMISIEEIFKKYKPN
jgi:hypothetical protein